MSIRLSLSDSHSPTLPPLTTLALNSIIQNFSTDPISTPLPPRYQNLLLASLPTTLPISLTLPLLPNSTYWQRCCTQSKLPLPTTIQDINWKQHYIEHWTNQLLENASPHASNTTDFTTQLAFVAEFVEILKLKHLHATTNGDHIDFSKVLTSLTHLKSVSMKLDNGEDKTRGMTIQDAQNLGQCIVLDTLCIQQSRIDCERVKCIIPTAKLRVLDLSMNELREEGARVIGEWMGESGVEVVNLKGNEIGAKGAKYIAKGIRKGKCCRVELGMNRLGGEGVWELYQGIGEKRMKRVGLECNGIGKSGWEYVVEWLKMGLVEEMDVSCNKVEGWDGEGLVEVVRGKRMKELDVRGCGLDNLKSCLYK